MFYKLIDQGKFPRYTESKDRPKGLCSLRETVDYCGTNPVGILIHRIEHIN
jgi:hypothetical protein